jgi:hypothetical protein
MRIVGWIAFAAVWTAGIAVGSWSMLEYELTPAEVERCPEQWPAESALRLDGVRPTLVTFLHPQCPCSRASVGELAELVARCGSRVSVVAVFIRPACFAAGWEKTDLWRSAEAIPGIALYCDVDRLETERFQAGASGETLLYSAGGQLIFHGGITASRGHRGENAGRATLQHLLEGEATPMNSFPVYGCPLRDGKCVASKSSPEKPQDP